MGAIQSTLDELINPVVSGLGYEYVGCDYLSQGKHSILRVYIDKPEGISVDDCTLISNQLSALLDVEDPIKTRYQLEVSSPGLERPLFTLAHYQRFVGSEVKVRLSSPMDEQSRFNGLIKSVDDDNVVLQVNEQEIVIPFVRIAKANLVYRG